MGRLQIDNKVHQQEEEIDSKKEDHLFPILHLLNLIKENLVKNFQKNKKNFTNHPQDQIIGNPSIGVRTGSSLRNIFQ